MAINRLPVMTVEDYFAWELNQERKHEYIDEEVFEMPRVSNKHDIITMCLPLKSASSLTSAVCAPS